ncbi:MAG TPA: PIN domain-containing protein [Terriglobia bacterium]|nr:PIN domain-containing protein [Terriglobia bacterium]
MRSFFDTSALIPIFMEDHEHHEASLKAFLKTAKKEGSCGAHSLAEVYATVTRLPGKLRLSGDQVLLFLENIRERLAIIALDAEEYYSAIEEAAAAGIAGGTVYDALLARCALKAKAEIIYTWNVKHFRQFGPEVTRRIKTP